MKTVAAKNSSPDTEPKVARVPWNPWLGVVFVVLIYYSAQLAGGLLLSIYPVLKSWSHEQTVAWLTSSTVAQFAYVLLAEALMLGALYLFLQKYHSSFKTIGLKRPRWQDLGYGLLAVPFYYAFYLVTVGLVSHFVPGLNVHQQQEVGFDNVQGGLALSLTFISLVVLPPLAEEILVRGFLYSSLKKALPMVWAVLLTSLIFAGAHLPEGGAAGPLYVAALDTFVLSLILIYLREKTGSLWASITLHAIKNSVAFVALFVFHFR